MEQDKLALLALHCIPGVGTHSIRQLISYCGSASRVFDTPRGKLMKIPGIGPVIAGAISRTKSFDEAERELRKAEEQSAKILFITDHDFPSRLKHIHDCPPVLYCKGDIDFELQKCVAIVGTRNATAYGKNIVEELLTELVPHDPLVISGLAYGIDIAAHKVSEKLGLQTIAILGSGLDVIYPQAHTDTAKRIQLRGGLVTENAFGTKPDAHNFPARNRIIAGLCDALIVVEAAEKGGALITADIANSYNRDVFAFPGNVTQPYSTGCNNLIKANKAHLITGVKDLEYIMNWFVGAVETPKKKTLQLSNFDSNERSVLQVLYDKSNVLIDELSWRSQLPMGILASVLLGLEFKGVIQALPGKAYKLIRD